MFPEMLLFWFLRMNLLGNFYRLFHVVRCAGTKSAVSEVNNPISLGTFERGLNRIATLIVVD